MFIIQYDTDTDILTYKRITIFIKFNLQLPFKKKMWLRYKNESGPVRCITYYATGSLSGQGITIFMSVMGWLKMYGRASSHKMLIATTEPDAAMCAVSSEYGVKLIARTTHFFKSLLHFQPRYFRPCQIIQACQIMGKQQETTEVHYRRTLSKLDSV